MEFDILRWLSSDNGFAVHVAVLVSLVLGGVGFPIPEDLPLLLSGVAAAKGIVGLQAAFLTCYLGVIISDLGLYWIGRRFGTKIVSKTTAAPWLPSITEERVARIRERLRRRRLFYIFAARHLFPIRTVTFLSAGALHVPFWEFLIADMVAGLVSVSLVIYLGYCIGDSLTPEVVAHLVNEWHFYVLTLCLIVAAFFTARFAIRRLNAARHSTQNTPDSPF